MIAMIAASPPANAEPDPHTSEDAEGAGDCCAHEGPVLVGDTEAMKVGTGLAKLVRQHACLGAGELEGLVDVGCWHLTSSSAARRPPQGPRPGRPSQPISPRG